VAQFADRVAVMYAGKIVEEAPVEELFESPAHPYTRGLLNSLPKEDSGQNLESIPGVVPNPMYLPTGCAFHPRCKEVLPKCEREIPPFFKTDASHRVACWLYDPEQSSVQP